MLLIFISLALMALLHASTVTFIDWMKKKPSKVSKFAVHLHFYLLLSIMMASAFIIITEDPLVVNFEIFFVISVIAWSSVLLFIIIKSIYHTVGAVEFYFTLLCYFGLFCYAIYQLVNL